MTRAPRSRRCSTSWRAGTTRAKTPTIPEIRALFTREALLASDWYRERLAVKQKRDVALWERHARSLTEFLARAGHREEAERLGIAGRLEHARAELERVSAPEYLTALVGTIGADPIHRPLRSAPSGDQASPGTCAGSGKSPARPRSSEPALPGYCFFGGAFGLHIVDHCARVPSARRWTTESGRVVL